MLDPEIVVAIVAGLASIIVALVQAWSSRTQAASQPDPTLPAHRSGRAKRIFLLASAVVLNLVAISAVVSWLIIRTPSADSDVKNYDRLMDLARLQRPYVLESVTVLVHLDDSAVKSGVGVRQAYVRITYVIRALRDITEQEGSFTEEYRLNPIKTPKHWYGTNAEDFGNDIGNTYAVRYHAKKGELNTIVTGMNYSYPMPMADQRVIPDGLTSMNSTQDYYMYLNTDDYIGELTVIVESSTTPLVSVDRGAFVNESQHPTARSDTHIQKPDAASDQLSISAQWRNLKPGQNGGVIYGWRSPPAPPGATPSPRVRPRPANKHVYP